MSTPTSYALLSISRTDETITEPDVIRAAAENAEWEVYPESLPVPADGDPVWVAPEVVAVGSPAAVDLLLRAAEVGMETAPDDDPDLLNDAWAILSLLRQQWSPA